MPEEKTPTPTAPTVVPQENSEDFVLELKHEEKKKKKKEKVGGASPLESGPLGALNRWLIMISPVPLEDKLIFFQLLASVLQAGIPVSEALYLLEGQTANPRLKVVIGQMKKNMDGGMSLAEAMKEEPEIFDEATQSIVAAGETSGKLNEVMRELVVQFERMGTIQKKVKSVMTYPLVVIIVMILAAVAVLLFVIPQLMEVFGDAKSLPTPTRIMIAASDAMQNQWHIILAVVAIVAFSFNSWKKTRSGKYLWADFSLYIPVIGDFLKKIALSRAMRILSFLIASGVPIIESLRIASRASGNVIYQKKLLLAADDLGRGIEISENFADDTRLFPPMLVSMINIGEKTASLGPVMGKIADFYDEDLDRTVGAIAKMMEPLIMVVMAIGVVFLLMAIYLPILEMNDKMVG